MIGALLGAGASIGSALIGNQAAEEAAETNWRIAMLNYQLRERERMDRIQAAQQARYDTHLGATDARGNSTKFIEGKGWVQDLSQKDTDLQDAQMREQMSVLSTDIPRRRRIQAANEASQARERFVGEGLMDEFKRIRMDDPDAIRSELMDYARTGINEAYNNSESRALRTAVRQGSSNTGQIIAEIARGRSKELSKAFQEAGLRSTEMATSRYDNARKNVMGMYGTMMDRASKLPDVSFTPQQTGGNSGSLMQQFIQAMSGDSRALEGAFGQKGGEFDYVQPNYALANGLASTGGVLANAFNGMGASSDLEARRKSLRQDVGDW